MSLICYGWKNKRGTSSRSCKCGSWKQHWIKCSKMPWPLKCCVEGCENFAVLGAHIYNANEQGEWILPACDSCNKLGTEFSIKCGVTLVPANKQNTCES